MNKTILIVDDSKLARMALAKGLGAALPDWPRLEAVNADEALKILETSKIAMTFLDFNMPGRDGLALAAEIRAIDPAVQIALISANHQTEVVTGATDIGATFLTKPLNDKALRDFIDLALARLKATSS